jgi:hypothetical protein
MDASPQRKHLRALARYASIFALVYLLLAAVVAYVYWSDFAPRHMVGVSSDTVANIERSSDPERLRRAALVLAKENDQLVRLFNDAALRAAIAIITLCLSAALVIGISARSVRKVERLSSEGK